MSADSAEIYVDVQARLRVLEETIADKISLRVAEAELKLQNADSQTDGELRHVKGQISMLVAGGVLTFLLTSGGVAWLINKALDVQGSLGAVQTKVGTLLDDAGKQVVALGESERKKLEVASKQQQEQINQIQKEATVRLSSLQPAPQASAPAPSTTSLDCISKVAVSPVSTYPIAVAALDAKEVQAGYQVISGGCSVPPAGQEGVRHNTPIIRSTPDIANKGWVCGASDPPNVPVPTAITAYAVACRLGVK